jgi:hypothetical protein
MVKSEHTRLKEWLLMIVIGIIPVILAVGSVFLGWQLRDEWVFFAIMTVIVTVTIAKPHVHLGRLMAFWLSLILILFLHSVLYVTFTRFTNVWQACIVVIIESALANTAIDRIFAGVNGALAARAPDKP